MTTRSARSGFTLIECLIAMLVGALLMGLAIAMLQNALLLERSGQRHYERHASLARLAEHFRADVWSATNVAEEAGKPATLHLRRPGGETIAYAINEEGAVQRTLFHQGAERSRETYVLPDAAVLHFEVPAGPGRQISLLYAERKPIVAADDSPYKKPLRIMATLARDLRHLAQEAQ